MYLLKENRFSFKLYRLVHQTRGAQSFSSSQSFRRGKPGLDVVLEVGLDSRTTGQNLIYDTNGL